jgi:hypothetical protein
MFTRRLLSGVVAAAALGLFGPHVPAGAGGADQDAAAAKPGAAKANAAAKKPAGKGANKPTEKEAEKSEAERPACMHCGATCGLVAVCVCKPGTRKTPKTEYEAKSDPLCVPCCSGPPWPWGGHRRAVGCTGCTGCETECQDAWVRQRKKLVKETKDEEKPTLERKVAWLCRGCGSDRPVSCTGGSDAAPRRAGWWPSWLPHP